MSSVIVARQTVINFLSKGTLNFGQRYLTNVAQCCRLRRVSYFGYACVLSQSFTDRTFQLRRQHVSSRESAAQWDLERKPPKFYRYCHEVCVIYTPLNPTFIYSLFGVNMDTLSYGLSKLVLLICHIEITDLFRCPVFLYQRP